MKRSLSELLLHGVIGGLIAGGIVAAWFLIVDLSTTQIFHTPKALAAIVLGQEVAGGVRAVLAYTLLHFGVFALLGGLMAVGLEWLGAAPGWLAAGLFGLGVLNAVHYSLLWLTGADVLTVLPPFHVVAANLTGGLALTSYLHRATGSTRPVGSAVIRGQELLAEGLATGLVGAAIVAAWFLGLDLAAGTPFRTPGALGSALLFGASGPAEMQTGLGVVSAYTVMHVLAFALAGTLFIWAIRQIERRPSMWLLFTLAFLTLEALFIPVVGLAGSWLLGLLGLWAVAVANLLAVGGMAAWAWRKHASLRRLVERPVATRV